MAAYVYDLENRSPTQYDMTMIIQYVQKLTSPSMVKKLFNIPVVLFTMFVISCPCMVRTTLCLKKCTNFETAYLRIIVIEFDDIGQKYSKVSRIEFACFSFHVGLFYLSTSLFVFQIGHRK